MKPVKLICPVCESYIHHKNYWSWVMDTLFHWFGKGKTKCPVCDAYSYMRRIKEET